eukprot:CAMPEP_0180275670 /NCGR_PEP_ID=MMETSP0988-20121125/5962_1 /TAXON_ID=697907 /ORGANISM="non described non described, Strain CCMP2293" /LENGTH=156 /DNA_ID=CAMNT_0022246943 /DNA_START=76 /DNA_END=546 /DNA_ORIENTATION=+
MEVDPPAPGAEGGGVGLSGDCEGVLDKETSQERVNGLGLESECADAPERLRDFSISSARAIARVSTTFHLSLSRRNVSRLFLASTSGDTDRERFARKETLELPRESGGTSVGCGWMMFLRSGPNWTLPERFRSLDPRELLGEFERIDAFDNLLPLE